VGRPLLAETTLLPAIRVPLKSGHRSANMGLVGNFDAMRVARQIPGLIGVELQVAEGQPNLRDLVHVQLIIYIKKNYWCAGTCLA
jgi:hypothetical protein